MQHEALHARRVLYLQYGASGAWPPLIHGARALAQAGWHTRFLGVDAEVGDHMTLEPTEGIQVSQLPYSPPGLGQKLQYLRYCFWTVGVALKWRPNWIYASDWLACLPTLMARFVSGARTVYHEHDPPSAGRPGVIMKLCVMARRRLARTAALCVIPNRKRAELFRAETGARQTVVVWNCPAADEVSNAKDAPATDGLVVYYHGTLNPERLPETVLLALAKLPRSVKLRVVGYETLGYPGYASALRDLAGRLGVSDQVEVVGLVTRQEMLSLCQQCDVGLSLMPKAPASLGHRYMVGASNKPFEYLASGLALLVSDLPGWRELYVDTGYGRACNPDDADSISEALRWFLDNKGEARRMGERGRQRILAEWNYQTQFAPILELMNADSNARRGDAGQKPRGKIGVRPAPAPGEPR